MLKAEDIRVGGTYRAKQPRPYAKGPNDRFVLQVIGERVQYDGPAVRSRMRYCPWVSMAEFLKWADFEVSYEQPANR